MRAIVRDALLSVCIAILLAALIDQAPRFPAPTDLVASDKATEQAWENEPARSGGAGLPGLPLSCSGGYVTPDIIAGTHVHTFTSSGTLVCSGGYAGGGGGGSVVPVASGSTGHIIIKYGDGGGGGGR